ncbi:hypothetical protein GIB67_034662 [Kingdonia uniflora]|uniref:Uncharacterized protein n=1 Tax=Kingdonia uniflora TaxID=39325 RepID=A0A7J7P0F7_9MAGN|nr:hypothetical protein GIB67_034662 [Kingdonia uniflora]
MVQYVSSMARNIFSSHLLDLGFLATFGDDAFEIMKEAIALAWDKRQDTYSGTCNINDEIIGVVNSMVDSRAWHEKLGHVSIWMKALFSRRILDKLKLIDLFFCEDIVLVKQKKVGFPRKRKKLNLGSNHLCDDVWEPTRVSSNGGFHGFVTFIDDSARELGVHFLKNETDWFDVFARWKAWVEIEMGSRLKCLGSNSDGDQFCCDEFVIDKASNRIERLEKIPIIPREFGMAETGIGDNYKVRSWASGSLSWMMMRWDLNRHIGLETGVCLAMECDMSLDRGMSKSLMIWLLMYAIVNMRPEFSHEVGAISTPLLRKEAVVHFLNFHEHIVATWRALLLPGLQESEEAEYEVIVDIIFKENLVFGQREVFFNERLIATKIKYPWILLCFA